MTTERTTIILGNDDRRAVDVIRQHTGIESRSAAIRYALREQMRAIEREKAETEKSSMRAQAYVLREQIKEDVR